MTKILDPTNPNQQGQEEDQARQERKQLVAPVLDPNVRRIVITMSPSLQGDRVIVQFDGFAGVPVDISQMQIDEMLFQAENAAMNAKRSIFAEKMKAAQGAQMVNIAQQALRTGKVQ